MIKERGEATTALSSSCVDLTTEPISAAPSTLWVGAAVQASCRTTLTTDKPLVRLLI